MPTVNNRGRLFWGSAFGCEPRACPKLERREGQCPARNLGPLFLHSRPFSTSARQPAQASFECSATYRRQARLVRYCPSNRPHR
jgi:hypothetical protein